MNNRFIMGAWVYNNVGEVKAEKYISDLKEVGFNIGFSSKYDGEARESLHDYIREFDVAGENGIKLIAYDSRTHWRTFQESGEEKFRRGVKKVRQEYGLHKGVYAFHIGDEPGKKDFDDVVKAARIVKEIIPEKEVFLNFYPYFDAEWFRPVVGANVKTDYGEEIKKIIKNTDIPVISYDCYSQCREDRSINGVQQYFENLEFFRSLSEKLNVPLWTSLLCVGHWNYRVPDENDIRWQISTAAAYGCKGILWFEFYSRQVDSYREAPIYGLNKEDRCETFYRLKRQVRFFMERFGDKFANSNIEKIMQIGEVFGNTPAFASDDLIETAAAYMYDAPLIVTEFRKSDGKRAVAIVNKSQSRTTRIRIKLRKEYHTSDCTESYLAPGDMLWIDVEKDDAERKIDGVV